MRRGVFDFESDNDGHRWRGEEPYTPIDLIHSAERLDEGSVAAP